MGAIYVVPNTNKRHAINFVAIRIISDEPIVLQAATINDLSSDAFLVLPVASLGNEYVVLSYVFPHPSVFQQGPSSVGLVATRDDTKVTISFPETDIVDDSHFGQYEIVKGSLSFTLQSAEAFQVSLHVI